MASSRDHVLAFDVDWNDRVTGIVWRYQLKYYTETGEIEMVDVKNKRSFLKRCQIDGVKIVPEILRPGAIITVLARQLYIVDFADRHTRTLLSPWQERTLAMIKPDGVAHTGKILDRVLQSGFLIGELRMCYLSRLEAEHFYSVHRHQPFFNRLTEFMSSGRIVAVELLAKGAVEKCRELLGPTDSALARSVAPESIRAFFGTDKTCNACHGSDAAETAQQECNFFFYPGTQTRHFDVSTTAELFELYKRVLPPSEFSSMVEEVSSGPSVALEVSGDEDTVETLRQLCGPPDPILARAYDETCLRAAFGESKAMNAVHCTDLAEDAARELSIAFS